MNIKVLKKKTILKKNRKNGENEKAIKLVNSEKLMLVGKEKEAGYLSKTVTKRDVLYLNIKTGKNREGGEGEENEKDEKNKEITVPKKNGKIKLTKSKKLNILIKNLSGSEL